MKIFAGLRRHPSTVLLLNVGAQNGLRLVSNLVLSHLLAPAAFALTSITMLILTGIHMATDVGIAVMVLRHGEISRRDESRMWTLQFVRGLLLAVLMAALAVPVARLYGSRELSPVMIAVGLVTVITGAQSLFPILRLAKRDLMPTFWVEVVGRLLGAAVSVLVALVSPTVWALVAGMLAQAAFSTVFSHVLAGHGWPKFDLDLGFARSQWAFTRWIQLSSLLTFAAAQIDKALFPLLYGLTRFGLYGIGATFAQIPSQIALRWASSVFYPLAVQNLRGGVDDRAVLHRIRLTMLLYTAVVVAGNAAVAPSFFYLLYKPVYHEAARFAALLGVGVYFELAELSLRHFPLADKTARYEIIAVGVRLVALLSMLAAVAAGHGNADLYAVAYSCAPAVSCLFMLIVCVRHGYIQARADLMLAATMFAVLVAAYFAPLSPHTPIQAVVQGAAFGLLTLAVMAALHARRGLPSLPNEPALGALERPIEEFSVA